MRRRVLRVVSSTAGLSRRVCSTSVLAPVSARSRTSALRRRENAIPLGGAGWRVPVHELRAHLHQGEAEEVDTSPLSRILGTVITGLAASAPNEIRGACLGKDARVRAE